MLIVALLVLFAASAGYIVLRQREIVWPARVLLGAIAVVAWTLSVAAYALATDGKVGVNDEISVLAKMLIAGFAVFPIILWAAAKMFERGRRT